LVCLAGCAGLVEREGSTVGLVGLLGLTGLDGLTGCEGVTAGLLGVEGLVLLPGFSTAGLVGRELSTLCDGSLAGSLFTGLKLSIVCTFLGLSGRELLLFCDTLGL